MKRWNKILALTFTLGLIAPTNILAEEIQLTDYRYENCMYGLYGYNFCDVFSYAVGDKNIFGDANLKRDKNSNIISANSVILKPDGTELFQQGKYEVSYASLVSLVYSTNICFPQYEFLFTARDRTTKEDCILDQYGNEVCRFYAGLLDVYSIDLTGPRIETVIMDTSRVGLVNEIQINGEKYLLAGGSYFGDNSYDYYGTVSLLIRESDWKVIINTTYDPEINPANLYISTDEQYLMIAGQEMYGSPDGHRQPVSTRYYYDLEGNVIEKPEGVEFLRYIDTGEYLQINSDGIVTTDKVNRNYTFKEKVIGGKSYYALFKELEEGETAADYIPEEQPSFWAVDTIRQATDAGLLYNNSNCRYTANISRQDFAVLAVEAYCKSLGMNVDEYVSKNNITLDFDKFEDTQNAYILLANELGILSGTSDTTFSPDRGITRQEAAVMLNNMAELSGLSPNSEQVDFVDNSYFATWAEDAIASISSIKNDEGIAIMGGTEVNKFSPWMTFSREQAYVTIYRLFEMLS